MKALNGQTLIDIATQYCGSADAAYDIAILNGLSVTDDPFGLELELPAVVNKQIASYYANKGLQPATSITTAKSNPVVQEGIGYWAIETEFIIS